jgi:cyclic-di-AMP phosphodiesterase PgpH
MNLIEYIRNKNALWYKVALYLISASLIVIALPKITYFPYDLVDLENKIWLNEDLKAPYEFSIYKDDAQVRRETDSVLQNTKVFLLDNEVVKQKLQLDLAIWLQSNSRLSNAKLYLDSCIRIGIADFADSALLKKGRGQTIAIIKQQIATDVLLNQLIDVSAVGMRLDVLLANDPSGLMTLKKIIVPTCIVDKDFTQQNLNEAISAINQTASKIAKDEIIVKRNEKVSKIVYSKLVSFKKEFEIQNAVERNFWIIFFGQAMYTGLCLSIIFVFLATFRRNIFSQNRQITFVVIVILFFVLVSTYVARIGNDFIYFIPYALIPVMIRIFFDSRTALFSHLITIFLCAYLAPDRFDFAFIQIITGIVAIFSVANLQSRTRLLLASVVILFTYVFTFITVLLFKGDFDRNLVYERIPELATASSLVIFAYPLVYLCEKAFGFISDFTLLELSNTNHPLLKELSHKAPGTFHHSLQVANLAEAAAEVVGANPLLTRTGALFHDIGKLDRPRYFVENRSGEADPHKDLPHDISAKIIIDHVIKGIERAKASQLPDQIIDFIRTHHGTSLVKYFYKSYLTEHTFSPEVEAKFHYPGPLPFSKETALLMMCDSVEAASRSLPKKDEESIHRLIDNIIDDQIAQQQFINSDITFKDIYKIKKVLKQSLLTIYHSRIEYPS